jgi:two-component system chemotaxis response regulator CheY
LSELIFLVIDDDGQVREILTEYLESFGVKNIIQAKDGKSGLKIVQNHAQHLDFIISDWEMPHIDGLTLLRAVRKDPKRENVKFLMVSSQSSRERVKISEAAKARVDAYVVKPFRSGLLKEKITNLILHGEDKSSREFEESFAGGPGAAGSDGGHDAIGQPPENYDLSKMNAPLVIKLAASYHKFKLYEKAIRLCTEASMVFPDDADILYMLGHTYYERGDLQEAGLLLKKVVALKPYHVEARTLMAEIEDKLKVA